VFLHPVESVSHVVHSDASGARNMVELFFMLGGWGAVRFPEECAGRRYTEVVFLYLVGSTGHLVHYGVSRT
jgi:hypothetical protein